jgi:hypothetical protein
MVIINNSIWLKQQAKNSITKAVKSSIDDCKSNIHLKL